MSLAVRVFAVRLLGVILVTFVCCAPFITFPQVFTTSYSIACIMHYKLMYTKYRLPRTVPSDHVHFVTSRWPPTHAAECPAAAVICPTADNWSAVVTTARRPPWRRWHCFADVSHDRPSCDRAKQVRDSTSYQTLLCSVVESKITLYAMVKVYIFNKSNADLRKFSNVSAVFSQLPCATSLNPWQHCVTVPYLNLWK